MTQITPYLRNPHLAGDLITFTAADDVWLAPDAGGRAWRLTRDAAPVRTPRLSPDGSQVAFISSRDGHPEVFSATVDTGEIRRLTWWGAAKAAILGWAPDGRLLVATHAVESVIREQVAHAVSLDGGTERLHYGSAGGLAISESGIVALATPPTRPAGHWKRYRGGVAGQLWLGVDGVDGPGTAGRWRRLLPEEPAGLLDPLWVDGQLVISSDMAATFPERTREQANLWVLDGAGAEGASEADVEAHQLTFQGEETGYVRDATTDGRRITWHSRGEIFILDSLDARPRRLEVALPGSAPAPLRLKPTKNLDVLAPDWTGDASAVSWRGTTWWLTHREGPARALAADSGVRTREPVVLGRSGRVAVATDAEGEDALEIHLLDGSAPAQRVLGGELGRVLHMVADPAGTRLAVISHDGRLRLIDLSESEGRLQASAREIRRSEHGELLDASFSPDGRYLLWSAPTMSESQMHQLMIADTASDPITPRALTGGTFHDSSPAFTADGKHIAFLSTRTLDPHYDDHEFNLSFAGSVRPWLLPLSAAEPAPFGPSAEGWRISAGEEAGARGDSGADSAADSAPVSPDLDDEHAEERIVAFPVASARYRDLRAVKGGLLWIRQAEETGELGTRRSGVDGEKPADQLIRWDFTARKATTLVEKLDSYAVSGDGSRLVVRSGDEVTAVPATRKAEKDDAERVTVDLSRLRLSVDRPAEWAQMFEETCRLMRQQFWREDMDGIDWDAVVERWRPVVARARTHDDLVDILWETVGELNTSHAYVMPAEEDADTDRRLGLLGADLEPAGLETGEPGWRITRILPAESSEPEARSPLRAAGVDAREGDVIIAVDGRAVDPVAGPNVQLAGAAGKPVELSLRRPGPAGEETRRVVVVPLSGEEELRYQDWVRSRREYVKRASAGRLGYVHVPDMTSTGWAQLHRDLRLAAGCEGIIADVRYNRGGHTSQMVIQRLSKQLVAWATARGESSVETYPLAAPRGPVVLVANRWSGSDGDIVNAAAQAMALGPVVGERTWGGVIGIDGRYSLVDGTVVTQPKYSFWIQGYGWGVENHGVDPDVEVVHDPGVWFAEEDPQLDRAIAEAFDRLEQTPASVPPPLDPPKNR
ncbi:S41 family peptidase [Nesterenkonia xinjiangensis]|uniref:Tricorn protease homolog n=1 Tax=Nesterenkonia xinjiangensis TaxID=225327 RepID=A0A7Z0GKR4_9MICC|nr:S41 family peptidase [Nesterenkonia xinjiangensis]NYJ77543.1 tricorn protease [Nesterenkonia xinjiangensis]